VEDAGLISVELGGVDESALIGLTPDRQKGTVKNGGRLPAISISDLEHDPEGYWRQVGGTQQWGEWAIADGVVFGVHVFNPRPGQRWYMYERVKDGETSEWGYVEFPSGDLVAIADRRLIASFGARPLYIDHDRWTYHVNGLQQPVRWDGRRVVPMGFVQPAITPSASGSTEAGGNGGVLDHVAANWTSTPDPHTQRGLGEFPGTGSGEDTQWRYGYGCTYVSDLGQESPLSPLVYVTGENPNLGSGSLSGLASARLSWVTAPDQARYIRFYRTFNTIGLDEVNGLEDVYFLEQFAMTGSGEWIDMKPDTELVEKFDRDSVGPVPLGISAMEFHQGACWVATDDVVQHSHPLLYEQFPPGNRIPVGSASTGRITCLKSTNDGLLVYREHAVHIIKGDAASGYRVETLSSTRGTVSARTVQQVTGVGMFALDDAGAYLVRGALEADGPTAVIPLPGISKTWRNKVGTSVLKSAWAVHNEATREVWFHVPLGGDSRPRLGLVYHYDLGQWSFRPDWNFACGEMYRGALFLGSHDTTSDETTGLHVVTPGSLTKHGAAFSGVYETGHIRIGDSKATVSRLLIRAYGGVGQISTIEIRRDREPVYQAMNRTAKTQEHQERVWEKWGEGVFSATKYWIDDEVVTIPFDLQKAHSLEHSFRITGGLRLVGLDLVLHNQLGAPGAPPQKR
jgi:hypothetical protein